MKNVQKDGFVRKSFSRRRHLMEVKLETLPGRQGTFILAYFQLMTLNLLNNVDFTV